MLDNAALLIIDMQNDFVRDGAPLAVGGAVEIIPNLQHVLDAFRRTDRPVLFVRRGHRADGSDIDLTRRSQFFGMGGFLVEGTPGAQIIEELAPREHEPVIVKRRWSAFFMTELLALLLRLGIKTLVLGGVNTANCIRSTAYDAISYDFAVTVLSDGTAAGTPDIQQANLDDMARVGINIATCAEVAHRIARPESADERPPVML
jgi:nicotinamidase-related amidase